MNYNEYEIKVGPQYQAVIPKGLCKYDDALPYENEDKLLWTPGDFTGRQVEDFLKRADGRPGVGEECALLALLHSAHDPEEALRRLRGPHPAVLSTPPALSSEECNRFEEGLASFGKDFRLIQLSYVHTRSIGELVHFYYHWKKSERFDLFKHHDKLIDFKRKKNENIKNYKRKEKLPLNPNIADFMGEFFNEGLKHITDSTVNLSLLNDEKINVKQEPFIKEESIED